VRLFHFQTVAVRGSKRGTHLSGGVGGSRSESERIVEGKGKVVTYLGYSFSLKTTGMLQSTRGVTRVMEEASGSSSEYMQF